MTKHCFFSLDFCDYDRSKLYFKFHTHCVNAMRKVSDNTNQHSI